MAPAVSQLPLAPLAVVSATDVTVGGAVSIVAV
jgi:hypothetical protein